MSFTKAKIYNLALSALLLSRQVSDTETDNVSNEVRILNQFWEVALHTSLQEMDLDSLSETMKLELIEEVEDVFKYVYKYPNRCAFLRRIKSCQVTDNRYTHIDKKVVLKNGAKVVLTNEYAAEIEFIPNDINLSVLNSPAAQAIAYKLAYLSTPLITGKGARQLREEIERNYLIFKEEAKRVDYAENFNYEEDHIRSEFVYERMS